MTETTVRRQVSREQLDKICRWWDEDKSVSLICVAMAEDPENVDGVHGYSLIEAEPHLALEILYRMAKAIKCKCNNPNCHLTQTAEAICATMELQVAEQGGERVSRH